MRPESPGIRSGQSGNTIRAVREYSQPAQECDQTAQVYDPAAQEYGPDAQEYRQASRKSIIWGVSHCLSELHRIPIAPGSRPAGIDGSRIHHVLFDEKEAPRHYENIDQLEEHLNLFLEKTKRKHRIKDLAYEPMVLCQSDLFPANFMIDLDGRPVIIDFEVVSILPSSFVTYALKDNRLGLDIREHVYVPRTEGIDNTQALLAALGPMVMGPYSFVSMGRRLPGGDRETQLRISDEIDQEDFAYLRHCEAPSKKLTRRSD